jgi:hypothetical protein
MRSLGCVSIISVMLNLALLSAGAAVNNARPDQWLHRAVAGQPPIIWNGLSQRLDRRKACNEQAAKRSLSGRMARRYTRLCVSGLPVPEPIRRSP